MITIDITEALDLLEAATEKYGRDNIYHSVDYNDCSYVRDADEESQRYCIVGYALHEKGVPDAVLTNLGSTMIRSSDVLNKLKDAGFEITEDAGRVLLVAQRAQDRKAEWGEAEDEANRLAEKIFSGRA